VKAERPFGQEQPPGPLCERPGDPGTRTHRTDIRHGIVPPVKTRTARDPVRNHPQKGYRTTPALPGGRGRGVVAAREVAAGTEHQDWSTGTEHVNLAAKNARPSPTIEGGPRTTPVLTRTCAEVPSAAGFRAG
jgi:hypothetical protein